MANWQTLTNQEDAIWKGYVSTHSAHIDYSAKIEITSLMHLASHNILMCKTT